MSKLSNQVQQLEEEVSSLRELVTYTQSTLSTFITNYHSEYHTKLFPKNRDFHTVPLEDLLKIINKNLNHEHSI